MDLRWDVLLAVVLGPDAEDWDAGDDPDDPGRPTGVRARSLYLMATSWPDHPDLPELAGRMVCDVDDEVRDIACATVEGFAADARLDDRVVRAVAAAAGQDDDGTGARELVTMLAEMWQPEPDRFPLMAALVDLAVPWRRHLPLLEPLGNVGTRGDDPPADARYTMVRLSPAGRLALAAERGAVGPVPFGLVEGTLYRDGTVPSFAPDAVLAALRTGLDALAALL